MKGREVIDRLTRHEMPDLQAVKAACIKQAAAGQSMSDHIMADDTTLCSHTRPTIEMPNQLHRVKPVPRAAINGTKETTRTTRKRRWPLGAAASIAACLVVAMVVVTVGYYMGGLGSLRNIVGDDQTTVLAPNETLSYVGECLSGVEVSGFKAAVVSVSGMDSNVIDVYWTLEDVTGNRLDERFYVSSYLLYDVHSPINTAHAWVRVTINNVIDRTDCGVLTLHNRHVFPHAISGHDVIFGLHGIHYNFREDVLALDFNLGTLTEQTPAAYLWDTPLLPPHLHDINIALAGFEDAGEIIISSMGLVNGRLHIQEQYDRVALNRWRSNKVQLINPYGDIVHPIRGTYESTASISFRIDANGHFYNDRGYNFVVDFPFRENIFDIDAARLSEYRLIASFDTSDDLLRDWRIARFELEMPHEQVLTLAGLEIELECYGSIINEIHIRPMTVVINASRMDLHDTRIGLSAGYGNNWTQAHIQLRTISGDLVDVNFVGTISVVDLDAAPFTERLLIDRAVRLDALDAILIDGYELPLR
ncbi:MAG: hypothetical protein FWC71_12215 [Defluviitaleaceae bacterium]|nr:hypothetical protein [Defluviitaleaceae bacterium]